jgi:sporulation protein YlmC with PRC-barrel domain
MLLSNLYGAQVRGSDGRTLGRVREVRCDGGAVTHIDVGAASWLERLTGGRHGRRIAWSAVIAVKGRTIVVDP